jgi:hypothetical protein
MSFSLSGSADLRNTWSSIYVIHILCPVNCVLRKVRSQVILYAENNSFLYVTIVNSLQLIQVKVLQADLESALYLPFLRV